MTYTDQETVIAVLVRHVRALEAREQTLSRAIDGLVLAGTLLIAALDTNGDDATARAADAARGWERARDIARVAVNADDTP